MLISTVKRFIFVANTKTASTSIEQVLRPHADIVLAGTPRRKHIFLRDALATCAPFVPDPSSQTEHETGHRPEQYFKFGVMRDPLDWISSWYRYRRGNEVESPLPEGLTLADFWARQDWNIQRADGSRYLQSDAFLAADGTVLADVIIPYHRLNEMFARICGPLGVVATLPHENVSQMKEPGDIAAGLNEEMRAFYATDYALLARLDEINARGMEQLLSGAGTFTRPAAIAGPAP